MPEINSFRPELTKPSLFATDSVLQSTKSILQPSKKNIGFKARNHINAISVDRFASIRELTENLASDLLANRRFTRSHQNNSFEVSKFNESEVINS